MPLKTSFATEPPRDTVNTTRWTDSQNRIHAVTHSQTSLAHHTGEALHTECSTHEITTPASLARHTQTKKQSVHVHPVLAGVRLEWRTELEEVIKEGDDQGDGEPRVRESWEGQFELDLSRFLNLYHKEDGWRFEREEETKQLRRDCDVLKRYVLCESPTPVMREEARTIVGADLPRPQQVVRVPATPTVAMEDFETLKNFIAAKHPSERLLEEVEAITGVAPAAQAAFRNTQQQPRGSVAMVPPSSRSRPQQSKAVQKKQSRRRGSDDDPVIVGSSTRVQQQQQQKAKRPRQERKVEPAVLYDEAEEGQDGGYNSDGLFIAS